MPINLERPGVGFTAAEREKQVRNLEKIEVALQEASSALPEAESAKALAAEAKNQAAAAEDKSENVQTQLNNLVVNGDSSPQATQASVGADGTEYGGNLKARLDAEHNKSIALLADKVEKGGIISGYFDTSSDEKKLGLEHFKDSAREAIAGTAAVNATPTVGSLVDEYHAVKAIGENKLYKTMLGSNLYDPDRRTPANYVQFSNGVVSANAGYDVTDFIYVLPNSVYIRNFSHQLAFYDEDKVYINGINSSSDLLEVTTFTTPANAKYVRMNIATYFLDKFIFAKGDTLPNFEKYHFLLKDLKLEQAKFQEQLNLSEFSITKSSEALLSLNLADPADFTDNVYVNSGNGMLQSNTSYKATGYIEVTAGEVYSRSYSHQMAFYNSGKACVSGISALAPNDQPSSFVIPANVKYMRITVGNAFASTFIVNKGETSLEYRPYGFQIQGLIGETDEIEVFLPSEIPIAVGRTIELYNKQVAWCGNINNYHFKWECAVGKSLKRKWSCEGVSGKIGSYPITLTIFDNNMKPVAKASSVVKIVSNVLANPVNVLLLADSLGNNKPWLAETRSLSNDSITFVGTRGTAPLKHEGRSGWQAGQFFAATTYPFENEGVHPFWNPNTNSFDYAYYKAQTGVNPNAIQIFLGTNGIALDPTTNAGNIKMLVDKIREVDASIPIYITYTLYRGDQNGMGKQLSNDGYSAASGVWKLEEDRKVFNLMVRLNDLLKDYTSLHFIPVSLTHDSEYNFGSVETPVNPRATQTEPQHVEATHPQIPGYMQFADTTFSAYAAHNA